MIVHPFCGESPFSYAIARVVRRTVNVGLVVGVTLGGLVVLTAGIAGFLFYWRTKNPPRFVTEIKGEVEIKEKLGGGNFGEVYRGVWAGADVAAKRLKDLKFSADFDREAELLQ